MKRLNLTYFNPITPFVYPRFRTGEPLRGYTSPGVIQMKPLRGLSPGRRHSGKVAPPRGHRRYRVGPYAKKEPPSGSSLYDGDYLLSRFRPLGPGHRRYMVICGRYDVIYKKSQHCCWLDFKTAITCSPAFAVPSALQGLTSLFGMGRGGALVLSSPDSLSSLPALSRAGGCRVRIEAQGGSRGKFSLPRSLPTQPLYASPQKARIWCCIFVSSRFGLLVPLG